MKLRLHNRQKHLRVNPTALKRLILFFLDRAARLDPTLEGEIGVMLMSDAGMRRLNRRYGTCDDSTDVLSFRYTAPPGIPAAVAGECFVNVQRACRLGPLYNGVERELALYLAHACDHLTGARDGTCRDRRRMRRREQAWLRQAAGRRLLPEDLILS